MLTLRPRRFIIVEMMRSVLIIAVLALLSVFAYAEESIYRIDIQGNDIVSDATIISKIKIRAGQQYNENVINEDVKNLYATGYFESVDVEKTSEPDGVVIAFKVAEKPVLKKITLQGNRFIREKQILDAIDLKEGSFVDEYKINETVRKIKDLYDKRGYSQAEVRHESKPVAGKNETELTFIVDEKGVLKVRQVKIEGNTAVKDGALLKVMKTRKAWLLNRGIFKEDVLTDDEKRIIDFYKLKGYSDVKVTSDVEFQPKGVYVTVQVDEGKRYYVGAVGLEGAKQVPAEEIKEALKLGGGDIYSEQSVYEGASRIREVYVDKGYIFAQVDSSSVYNPKTEKVDVDYSIVENDVAYVSDIEITGNVKTRDKVIRRELRVYPGERFDGKKVRKSKERLENLGFFEEIRFGTEPGPEPDKIDLIVDVKEAKTGYLSFGGGYSSIDEFIGFVELRQRNFDYRNWSTFTGGGQDLTLLASLGTLTDRYQVSFTNPWIFDHPVSFGFDAYKKGHRQDEDVGYGYAEDVVGGDLRLGREFGDIIKTGVAYRFDNVKISDVVDSASQELKDEEGSTNLSSVETSASLDTRDNVFSTTKGLFFTNAFQFTGGPFGGDKDFFKYYNRLSLYIPAVNKSVVELRGRVGIADPFDSTVKVPIYERFFAGGASTIRGYQERKVGPIDPITDDPIGGESMFVANVEYTYPLVDFLKVAVFYDTGNVWRRSDDFLSTDLLSSIGLGLRVKTPIGPVSVDYGWPLDLEPGETDKEGRFHFNISREF